MKRRRSTQCYSGRRRANRWKTRDRETEREVRRGKLKWVEWRSEMRRKRRSWGRRIRGNEER